MNNATIVGIHGLKFNWPARNSDRISYLANALPESVIPHGSPMTDIHLNARRISVLRLQYSIQEKLQILSPVSGLVTTPHLKEKTGQYLKEGDLICIIEEPTALEVEIAVGEQEVARVQPGQAVDLKARALPFETFTARVDRIAPAAGHGEVQSTVTLYCRLEEGADLRPGMTGHARVYTGRRPAATILYDRALRFLRTEFWW